MKISRLIVSLCFFALCSTSLFAGSVYWTGALNNDWSKDDNWSGGNVPQPGDDVFITVANAAVELYVEEDIRSLYISGNAGLTIYQSGMLNIDVNNVQLEGVLIQSGQLIVKGVMQISNVHSSGGNSYSIENKGHLEIDGHVLIKDQTFSGGGGIAGAAIYNRNGANFIISGNLEVENIGYDALRNSGHFEVQSSGDVDFSNNVGYHFLNIGVVNASAASFINDGVMAFDDGDIKGFLHSSNATATNNGIMNFSDCNFSGHSDFNNTGFLNLFNGKARFGSLNSVNQTAHNTGTISVNNVMGSAIEVIGMNDFINDGIINNNNCRIGLNNNGDFINNQSIIITNSDWVGVANGVAGNFDNYGSISIDGQQELNRAAFSNQFNFTNYPTGTIDVINCLGRGFQNAPNTTTSPVSNFLNQGSITIDNTGQRGLFQQLTTFFKQEGTLSIGNNTDGIYNGPGSEFKAKGELPTPSFDNHGILKIGTVIDTLNIQGDFENGNLGKVVIKANGHIGPGMAGGYDQLIVDGDLTLDGDMEMEYLSYSPSIFHTLTPIKYNSDLFGFFESHTSLNPSHQPQYSTDQEIKLKFEQCNGNAVDHVHTGTYSNWSNTFHWDNGYLPYPCESVLVSGQSPLLPDTLTLDVNATIANIKLTNSVLIIPAGKTLEITQNYGGGKGIDMLGNSAVINNGTLIIQHVKEDQGILVGVDSELINNNEIIIDHISGNGSKVVQNYGAVTFASGTTLTATNIYPGQNDLGTAMTNYGQVIMNGDFIAPGALRCLQSASSISGSGSFQIDSSEISGSLNPGNSAGQLNFTGNLKFTSNAQLNIEIAGNNGAGSTTGHDRLYVDGNITLNGILNIFPINGYTPTIVDNIDFIYAQSRTGNFTTENLVPPVDNWNIVTSDPNLLILIQDLDCINTTMYWTGNGDGSNWTHNKNWQYDKVPKACHHLTISNASNQITIDNSETVEGRSLSLSNSILHIAPNGELNLNGDDYNNDILVNQSGSTIYNEGTINISNSDGNQAHGIKNSGILENYGSIHVSGIKGPNSNGIHNLSTIENYDSIRIDNVPNQFAFSNGFSSSSFDNILNSVLEIDNSFGGIFIDPGSQQFQNNGTLRFISGFGDYTIYAKGDFSTLDGAKLKGAVSNGLGVILKDGIVGTMGGEID